MVVGAEVHRMSGLLFSFFVITLQGMQKLSEGGKRDSNDSCAVLEVGPMNCDLAAAIIKKWRADGVDVLCALNRAGKDGLPPLARACRVREADLVKLLLDKGANILWAPYVHSGMSDGVFHEAVNGNAQGSRWLATKDLIVTLQVLIAASAAKPNGAAYMLNKPGFSRDTSLMRLYKKAVHEVYTSKQAERIREIATLFLRNGADHNLKNICGKTILMELASCATGARILDDFIKLVGDRQLEVNACSGTPHDGERKTALHFAVEHANEEMVTLLLQAGADPLMKDRRGDTPLHCLFKSYLVEEAERRGRVVRYLTMRRLGLAEIKNKDGFTPIGLPEWNDMAERMKSIGMLRSARKASRAAAEVQHGTMALPEVASMDERSETDDSSCRTHESVTLLPPLNRFMQMTPRARGIQICESELSDDEQEHSLYAYGDRRARSLPDISSLSSHLVQPRRPSRWQS